MWFCCTQNKEIGKKMSKKRCKKDDYKIPDEPKFICKKCGRMANKEEKICHPQKIKPEK